MNDSAAPQPSPSPPPTHPTHPSLWMHARVAAIRARAPFVIVALLVLIVLGGVPGTVMLRALVIERTAPPLPEDTRDRDAAIDLRARDDAGAPVAGAVVRVFAMRDDAADSSRGARAFLAGEARTNAEGAATLINLPRGETWIVADAPKHARASSNMVLAAGARAVELVLGAAHRLDVDVKDERGEAIAGAEIEIASAEPLPIGARAGADGAAHIARLGAPPWVVMARAQGYEEVSYRGVREGEPLHATLRKLGAVVVRVVDGEQPAAGARVQIASAALWPARVAETRSDGTVRIGGLGAGSYALRAVRGDRASPIELGVSIARGEEKSVTLHLGPGTTVATRVMDSEQDDAMPIAGARVTLVESGLSPFPIEGTTDREGRARLGPIARGEASLAARADGYVARGAIVVPDPPPTELRVTLERAGVVEGRVVDARGFPIDGATIEIIGTDFYGAPIDDDPRRARFRDAHFTAALAGPSPLVPAGELGVMPGPVPPIPHGESALAPLPFAAPGSAVSTDEPWVTRDDGTYRASPVSPGRIRVLVRHAQYVEALSEVVTLAPEATVKVDVVMHVGGILEGRVVDAASHAVEGVRVTMAAARGSMERATRTASDGSFAFAAVPESVTVLVSRDEDLAHVEARAVVTVPEAGKKTITITLPDARPPLPVRVKDDRGYALELVQISAASLDPSSALRTTAYTDPRGEAEIVGGKGLPLRLEVRAPGHATKVVTTEASAASIDVALAAAESARGEVRSARGGEPIVDAEVVFYTEDGARHARTDAEGAFRFDDLAAGPGRVTARAPGFVPVTRDVVIEANGGRRPSDVPRIELAPGGSVEGLVRDARGNPIAGARVARDHVPTYLTVGATPAGVAVADGKGRFKLDGLPEGAIVLEAYAPDVGRAREGGVQVVSGRATRDVVLTLKASEEERATEPSAAGGVAITLGETSEPRELVVVSVVPGSEAERAGIAPNDVIVEVDGAPVHAIAEARPRLGGPLAADVLVKLRRGDRTETVRVAREQVRR